MMLTVDGVYQGPGGPDEDRGGGFERGGWTAAYADPEGWRFLTSWFERADLERHVASGTAQVPSRAGEGRPPFEDQRLRLPASARTSIGSPIASLTREAHESAASLSAASIK
jgi:hypothetical protein